tara:strand:- start:540 stop:737 length:198 start_codon:yes stop_codon:yes gene_type:complete
MLKLSREINETVMVGDEIQVKVLAIRDDKVLLGFVAPSEVAVHREEVYKRNTNKAFKKITDYFYK